MPANSLIQTRIDATLKKDAAAALSTMGLTISDAVRMMLIRVAEEKALPFEIRTPNTATRAAMAELDAGLGVKANSVADLMAQLNAAD